jgi:hypothetical protein
MRFLATGNADYEITVRVGDVSFWFDADELPELVMAIEAAKAQCDRLAAARQREDDAQRISDFHHVRGY